MNKNNDKQRTTHENYWEPKKKLWTNQGKSNENHRKNNEKPKKEQWKTMETKDNFASILSYLLAGTFGPWFFEFSIFNVERNKRQCWKKKETCLEVSWRLSVHKTLEICSELHFRCICVSNRGYFSLCCFWDTLMEENTLHGENLACLAFFKPKICILYGNTVVWVWAHWNLEYSLAVF